MSLQNEFLLRKDITHLNHGAFGACPRPIFDDYQRWQLELERNTFHFFVNEGPELLNKSREALGAFIGCDADDVVYTTNPSYALNTVIKSLSLNEGDEVLTTDLEYGAMDRTWNYYCRQFGAKYIKQKTELPLTSKDQFVEDFFKGLTSKTRIVFISHITSTTALKLPVEEICDRAKDLGLMTIVDGAHVPGHIDLNLKNIKADIYTGACHKWLLTPKGCSFLYVHKDLQPIDPLVISWGYESDNPSDSQFIDHHQMQGTRDYAAFLTVPKALEFRQSNNWDKVAADCRALARNNHQSFCDATGGSGLSPVNEEFLGQMVSLSIKCGQPDALQSMLYEKYRIQIPVMPHGDHVFIRYSINAYNSQEDLDRLFTALREIRTSTNLLG